MFNQQRLWRFVQQGDFHRERISIHAAIPIGFTPGKRRKGVLAKEATHLSSTAMMTSSR